jgi:hypothetical protein
MREQIAQKIGIAADFPVTRSCQTTTSELSMIRLVKLVLREAEGWEEEEWTPRTCSLSCSVEVVDSLAEEEAVSYSMPLEEW